MSSKGDDTPSLVQLEWCIRAIAQEADFQMGLYPPYVCVADELALEFEECLENATDAIHELGENATNLIDDLDNKLASISGPANAEFWTDDALKGSPLWNEVRMVAREIIRVSRWDTDAPPSSRAIYVGPDA